jgi:hypothetical protein
MAVLAQRASAMIPGAHLVVLFLLPLSLHVSAAVMRLRALVMG